MNFCKNVLLIILSCAFLFTSNCRASNEYCDVPDDALFQKETVWTDVPSWYNSGVVWFAGLTTSNKYVDYINKQAIIYIDHVTVSEECNGSEKIIIHDDYDYLPGAATWLSLYIRHPWFGGGVDDSHDEHLNTTVSNGILIIPVSRRPDKVAHWWTERFAVKNGCLYIVTLRFKITGDASLNIGMDWWRTMTATYNFWEATCVNSNNCEAWFSDWFSNTNDEFVTVTVPYHSRCNDINLETIQSRITEIYVATFKRAPDTAGLGYWMGQVNAGILTIDQVAQSFFDQPETKVKYPQGTSDVIFVTTIYQNVFNRAPDQAGLDYWTGKLSQGAFSRSQAIMAIINGAKAASGSPTDATILANKEEVAEYFATSALGSQPDQSIMLWHAQYVMSNINSSPSSVAAAIAYMDSLSN